LLLDAGFLISVDRGEGSARVFLTAALRHDTRLATTHPVVAQVWRDGSRQARLARFLHSVVIYPFDDGSRVGNLLARSGSIDVVDAHLVTVAARLSEPILTGDVDDLEALIAALDVAPPPILAWRPGGS